MSKELRERLDRYLNSLKKTLSQVKLAELEVSVDGNKVRTVLDLVERYYRDALHYLEEGDLTTSLVCVVYAEGLLDTLRVLGLASFKWPFEA
ncbi:MAG: hypothetical protein DRJ98_00600 [Thermoprotei archaeon]|nr:MAG: hypothetical protein DRJ98_00600 [Thermoprotei archaeon]RLF17907.1 MAG: hypothetical protein DRN06_02820 [Thermoprotei archaeon]